jgi:anti-sigma B factor antagonist
MALSLEHKRVGNISVFACRGRIVEGAETRQLAEQVGGLLPHEPFIVLDLGEVDFLDSSGLGLLVRLLSRTRAAHGDLKLCGVPARVAEILRLTRLHSMFGSYASEAEAVAAFYVDGRQADAGDFRADILCVDTSPDVLAYVRVLLGEAGYGVTTASNLYDALILFRARKPGVVVIEASLRSARTTETAQTFNQLIDSVAVVELESGFSREDAGDAGRRLLDRLKSVREPTR